ncbi:TraR/DksA C4-type zinc finger protein [Patescibacteria group bacterium]|nr:TraR/DksA C4-type zinc finger protein [Patescibacteria group bacterium]
MDTKKYKEALEKELELLTKELKGIGVVGGENPDDWVAKSGIGTINDDDKSDDNDNADDLEELGERNAIVSDLEIRFRNVKEALKRIEDGTYGMCEVSGHPIEEDRLEANPAATTCKEHMNG